MDRNETHNDQCCSAVFVTFLHEITVVLLIKLDAGAADCSKEALKEGQECLKHGTLCTGKVKCGEQRFGDEGRGVGEAYTLG